MEVRILCNGEELKKMDDIQEAFNLVMKILTNKGFVGTITIEKKAK